MVRNFYVVPCMLYLFWWTFSGGAVLLYVVCCTFPVVPCLLFLICCTFPVVPFPLYLFCCTFSAGAMRPRDPESAFLIRLVL